MTELHGIARECTYCGRRIGLNRWGKLASHKSLIGGRYCAGSGTAAVKALVDYGSGEHVPLSVDSGCDACGTCVRHDGCADSQFPLVLDRGDCESCGACGDCVADCAKARETEATTPDGSQS